MTCHHKLALGACLSSTQFSFNVLYVEILKILLRPVLYIHIFFFKPNKVLTSSAHHMFSRKTNFQEFFYQLDQVSQVLFAHLFFRIKQSDQLRFVFVKVCD